MTFLTSRRSLLRGVGGLTAASSLGACANARVIGLDRQRKSLDISNSGEPLSLDPQKCSGVWENNIVGNMFIGLTTEDAHSRPIPGMAERWETSADGRTWTFFLRQAVWSDGQRCNAHDFEFSFKRMLDPAVMAEYASVLYPFKNAEAINNGHMPKEQLGVSALDDLTLEIQLEHPAPYLPQLLKHFAGSPVPKHLVLRHGDDWVHPSNIAVNGPYTLKKWWSNYIVHLERNPSFWENRSVVFDNLYFYPTNDVNAAARKVRSGESGWATRFPSNQVEELRRALPGYVRVSPWLAINYFVFNLQKPLFADLRVRQALTMALNREFIATQIYKTGELPAYKFVPPGTADYPGTARYSWADMPLDERRVEAERLLRAAGYGPNNPVSFELSHRNTGDAPRVAVVTQSDWRAIAPWVTVELRGVETQVHYANMRARNYDVGDAGWNGDFNDAKNYLFLFETRSGQQNYTGFSNPRYDQLVRDSDFEADAGRRAQLMVQAEQLLLDEAPLCTSVFQNSTNLVHPDLTGYENNVEDIHRARWFGIKNA